MKKLFSIPFAIIAYIFFTPFNLYPPNVYTASFPASAMLKENSCSHPHEESKQVFEHTLKNGVRVCIKPSKRELGQVEFQFFAVGGFSTLPVADRVSAWMAPAVIMESGLAPLSGDELVCALDDRGIELEFKLRPFDRYFEVACPCSEMPYSLQLIHSLFTRPQCNEAGMKNAVAQARKKLEKKQLKEDFKSRDIFLKVNLKNSDLVTPFSTMNLDAVQLEKAESIYKAFFANPSEFMCVMIGDIDPKTIIPLLESTLGALPAQTSSISQSLLKKERKHMISFQESGIKKDFFGVSRYKSSLTRITFPLSDKTLKPLELDLICTILKQRLIKILPCENQSKDSLKVFYEFPLFPCFDASWLVVQFSSQQGKAEESRQEILALIGKLNKVELSPKEFQYAIEETLKNRQNNLVNDSDELSLISNYYRAGWSIQDLYPSEKIAENEMMKKASQCYADLNKYSIITLHP